MKATSGYRRGGTGPGLQGHIHRQKKKYRKQTSRRKTSGLRSQVPPIVNNGTKLDFLCPMSVMSDLSLRVEETSDLTKRGNTPKKTLYYPRKSGKNKKKLEETFVRLLWSGPAAAPGLKPFRLPRLTPLHFPRAVGDGGKEAVGLPLATGVTYVTVTHKHLVTPVTLGYRYQFSIKTLFSLHKECM